MPSIVFSTTLPVKPSVTTTSAAPVVRSVPSTLPTNVSAAGAAAARAASAACASITVEVPFVGSSPFESRPTRGRSTPSTICASAAPMKANWTRCSGRTSALAPTSTSVIGLPGIGTGHRERRAVDAAVALDLEQAGGERRARRAAADEGVGVAGRDGPDGAHDRGVRGRAHGARGIGGLGDRDRRVDTSTPSATSPISSAAPNSSTRTPWDAAIAAPAATSAGPRSAPPASTATVTVTGTR